MPEKTDKITWRNLEHFLGCHVNLGEASVDENGIIDTGDIDLSGYRRIQLIDRSLIDKDYESGKSFFVYAHFRDGKRESRPSLHSMMNP